MIPPLQNEKLFGHKTILNFILNSLKNNTLHNSYLLKGPYGVGKETFALYASKLIIANDSGARLEEISKKMQNNTLDNFLYIKKEDSILVEDTKYIMDFLSKKTVARKCIVIDSVEKMTTQSANSILKSIEEANNSTFFLITSFDEMVIKTIRSRSIVLDFKPLNKFDFESTLQHFNYNIDETIKDFSCGAIGFALKIDELEKKYDFLSILIKNITSDSFKIDASIKENIDIVILFVSFFLEQLLLGGEKNNFINYTKNFTNNKNDIIKVYDNILLFYKNYQRYNLEKESFLNYVFKEIAKIKN